MGHSSEERTVFVPNETKAEKEKRERIHRSKEGDNDAVWFYRACNVALDEFLRDEEDGNASEEEYDVHDHIQPGSPTIMISRPDRVTASKTLEMLVTAYHGNGNGAKKANALKWCSDKFKHNAVFYIKAANQPYGGVVIPLSKAEEKRFKELNGYMGKRGVVSSFILIITRKKKKKFFYESMYPMGIPARGAVKNIQNPGAPQLCEGIQEANHRNGLCVVRPIKGNTIPAVTPTL